MELCVSGGPRSLGCHYKGSQSSAAFHVGPRRRAALGMARAKAALSGA